jgi:hypothetical protein
VKYKQLNSGKVLLPLLKSINLERLKCCNALYFLQYVEENFPFTDSSILGYDAVYFTFQGVNYIRNVGVIAPTIRRHVTEVLCLQQHLCDNLKSHAFAFLTQIVK